MFKPMIKYTKIMIQASSTQKLLNHDISFHVLGWHVIKIKLVMRLYPGLFDKPNTQNRCYSKKENYYSGYFVHPPDAFQAKLVPEDIDKSG